MNIQAKTLGREEILQALRSGEWMTVKTLRHLLAGCVPAGDAVRRYSQWYRSETQAAEPLATKIAKGAAVVVQTRLNYVYQSGVLERRGPEGVLTEYRLNNNGESK